MADNVTTDDGNIASDEIDILNGVAQSGTKPQAQRVKIGFGLDGVFDDVNADNPFPVADVKSGNLLGRILQMLMAPLGYDKSLGRQRGTVIVESGTVTTVSTVNTVSAVTTITNIPTIGGYPAQMQIIDNNRTAWAQCVRARIT